MIRKRSKFFTFIFSFLPGAGEMYMGFFKQGSSLMLLTFAFIAFSSIINCGPLLAILPVLWFYSFFHVHALASMNDEEFYQLEDRYIFDLEDADIAGAFRSRKVRKIFAVLLIIIGISSLWKVFTRSLSNIIPNFGSTYLSYLLDIIPQVIVAFLVIAVGYYLIRGKKEELYNEVNEPANPLIEDQQTKED